MEMKSPPTPLNFKKRYWYTCKTCHHSGYTDNPEGACSSCRKKFTSTKTKVNSNKNYVGLMQTQHEAPPKEEIRQEVIDELEDELFQDDVVDNGSVEQVENTETPTQRLLGEAAPLSQHEIDQGYVETYTTHEEGVVIDTDNELVSTVVDDDTDEARRISPSDTETQQLSEAKEKEVREQLKVMEQLKRYKEDDWYIVKRFGRIYLCLIVLVFFVLLSLFIIKVSS